MTAPPPELAHCAGADSSDLSTRIQGSWCPSISPTNNVTEESISYELHSDIDCQCSTPLIHRRLRETSNIFFVAPRALL